MLVQLPRTESGMMKVVSNTIINAMPSTPKVNRTPHVGIHAVSIGACQPLFAGLNDHQRPSETRNSRTKSHRATWRAAGVSMPSPAGLEVVITMLPGTVVGENFRTGSRSRI